MFISLARLKARIGVSGEDEVALADIAEEACAHVETYCNTSFTEQAYTETHDGGSHGLVLNHGPIISVRSVFDQSAGRYISAAAYRIDPGAAILYADGYWTSGRARFQVDYRAGYTTPPEPVILATLRAAELLWNESRTGLRVTSERIGDINYTYSPASADASLARMLEPYRRAVL